MTTKPFVQAEEDFPMTEQPTEIRGFAPLSGKQMQILPPYSFREFFDSTDPDNSRSLVVNRSGAEKRSAEGCRCRTRNLA